KELVKLLGGEISVKSEVGKGTAFEVRLPLGKRSEERDERVEQRNVGIKAVPPLTSHPSPLTSPSSRLTPHLSLLIVEDNPDVVRYLQSFLSENYRIEVAVNGRQGIEKAIEAVPDIIISDVMMPEADGYELCETLKKDERTSHVPIILLTAKADATSRLEGLECGADAYLAKPFDREELLVRLRKMVELRKRMQERYRSAAALPVPVETRELQIEDVFMKKVRDILEAHLGDENFGIPDLCKALGMSRAQLYRKFQALTDQPIGHYFRSLRLHRAKALLETASLNISQVALEVGFKDLGHFSRSFHQEFGISPSEWRRR
ncbi:MAG: response regulator, partial [Bacteroidetes bacterium]|nr:response regulator [Bacteroidota bacterium]